MSNHIFSIFPLMEGVGYARYGCIALEDSAVPSAAPIVVTREQLIEKLDKTSLRACIADYLQALDEGTAVQVPIGDADARILGCQPRVI